MQQIHMIASNKLQKAHPCYLASAQVDLGVDTKPMHPPIQHMLVIYLI